MPHDILEEHIRLRVITDRLHAILAAPENILPESRWHQLLALELRELLAALDEHFEHEERDGYMEDVVRRHPRTQHSFADLFGQHGKIRDGLRAALERASRTPLAELRRDIHELLTLLTTHEAAETELVQDAIQHDIGVGD